MLGITAARAARRVALGARTLSSSAAAPLFFDMVHSNNAARVRLWLRMKGMTSAIETRFVTYPDLQTAEFAAVNPLKKVPALVRADGVTVFESNVILDYLEDKYGATDNAALGASAAGNALRLQPPTPEERQFVALLMRVHDLYIASPNCTQPGFAHTQGCMYLAPYETAHCRADRAMDRATRAAKLNEIRTQLAWLEANAGGNADPAAPGGPGPYLAGPQMTLADMTWFPTHVFMEYMLPRVYDWPDLYDKDSSPLPKIAAWYQMLIREHPEFAGVRDEIYTFWQAKDEAGQFDAIVHETNDPQYNWAFAPRD